MEYAEANGNIKVRDNVEVVKDKISQLFTIFSADSKTIVVHFNDKYDENEFYDLYKDIIPYISEAEIDWEGPEGKIWKHTFDGSKWKETLGEIVYKTTPDDEDEEDREYIYGSSYII